MKRDHSKYAEQDRARAKAWYWANRERSLQRSKEYAEFNREQVAAQQKAWRQSNLDKMLASTHAYEARKLGLFVEQVERPVVWERDNGLCHLCGMPADPEDWHLEHVIALADGGPHCYANTAVAHPSCNHGKRGSSRSGCGVRWAEATSAYKQFHDKEYT